MSEYITPVMYLDPSGESFVAILAMLALGAFIGRVTGFIAAAINGDDLWAGFVSGAISGAIITAGVATALTLPVIGGILVSGGSGFAGGFLGDVFNQGISNGWDNIDYGHAAGVGAVTGALTLVSFGISRYIYTSTPGIFSKVLDKSVPWLSRMNNSLSINVYSFYMTGTYGLIGSIGNSILNLFIKDGNKINYDASTSSVRGIMI